MGKSILVSYCCPHCGKPTIGRIIGIQGKKKIYEMCRACRKYVGSPAASQKGATMKNRIEMERRFLKSEE